MKIVQLCCVVFENAGAKPTGPAGRHDDGVVVGVLPTVGHGLRHVSASGPPALSRIRGLQEFLSS